MDDKKAQDIIVLDMRKQVNFCDYCVLCSGNTDRMVRALSDHIIESLKEQGYSVPIKQGGRDASWIVLDAGDIVTHIFQKDARNFYRLESLWSETKEVKWA